MAVVRVHTTFAKNNKPVTRTVTLAMTKAERSSKKSAKKSRTTHRRRVAKRSPSIILCNPTPLLHTSTAFSPSVSQSPVNTNEFLFTQHAGDSRKLSWSPAEQEGILELGIDTFGSHLAPRV